MCMYFFFSVYSHLHRRLQAGTLSTAERSYPMSEVRGSGLDGQVATAQEQPRGATLRHRSGVAAERSYPVSKLSGGQEELPHVRGQGWWPRGATPPPRSGAVTLRSHHEPEARGGSKEEPPTPEARPGGPEEQPEERWLCRHRGA